MPLNFVNKISAIINKGAVFENVCVAITMNRNSNVIYIYIYRMAHKKWKTYMLYLHGRSSNWTVLDLISLDHFIQVFNIMTVH